MKTRSTLGISEPWQGLCSDSFTESRRATSAALQIYCIYEQESSLQHPENLPRNPSQAILPEMASASMSTSDAHENQDLSKLKFQKLLQAAMKYKARSHNTYQSTHVTGLNAEPKVDINTVLIGDSMFERLKNTGRNTRFAQLPSSFNAGVGGDKIENVLYRLDLGLMSQLDTRNVKLWVVMIGTNNLKKALKKVEVERYRLLLQALLRISPRSRILCCEIFKRKDIDDCHVEESNRAIRGVIEEMNGNLGEKIFWVEAPDGVTKERLVDHVHLDKEGYILWDEVLYARVEELSK